MTFFITSIYMQIILTHFYHHIIIIVIVIGMLLCVYFMIYFHSSGRSGVNMTLIENLKKSRVKM